MTPAVGPDAPRVHYSFVVDAPGRFGYQAYLLARSLIELGAVPADGISAHLVAGTDGTVEQLLHGLGIATHWVEAFGHPYCNRLQQLPHLANVDADQLVLLDTDLFAIRPLEMPPDGVIWGKMVDAPHPPLEILQAIYQRAAVRLDEAEADVIPGGTARGNFNGGLYIVPKGLLASLASAWTRWARWSLHQIELYGQWHANVDQVSFALAAAELDLPIGRLAREFNTPTHLGPLAMGGTPALLHYHRNMDGQLFLRPSGEQKVDAAVGVANEAIRSWRRADLVYPLFSKARSDLFPSLPATASDEEAATRSPTSASDNRPGGTVTVVIPAYRPGARFVGVLESLAAQTYTDVLIRVSLDHSPGHILPDLPDLRGKRLEFIQQPQRLGWVSNVNALLGTVTTPFFVILAHDDQLSPRYIEQAVDVLERHPSVVVAHGTVRHHGIREGDVDSAPSISGDRMQRVMKLFERGPHKSALGYRGVVRSELLSHGLRLRARRSDGMFANDLLSFEIIVHGDSVSIPDIFFDKFTDPGGLSRDYHHRTYEQRAAMLADNLACLVDVVKDAGFPEDEQIEIAWRYANWLLGLQGNWNVVSEERNSDNETYASVRPAIALFAAQAVLSAAGPEATGKPSAGPLADAPVNVAPANPSTRVGAPARSRLRSARRWLSRNGQRALLRLPHPLRSNPLFDPDWYRERYADVAEARANPYRDYWRRGIGLGRDPNALFDTDWYLAQYPDVDASGMDPLDHYVRFGAREGRDPGPEFDTDSYLSSYPDVAENGMNPLLHYLRYGEAEGRSPLGHR